MAENTQIYSAKYSNVPVFEFVTLEGPIMRRKLDSWINATHILKIAKLPKAKRTRILEKDVQTGIHEKVQGGYGKYQGTYVPLELGEIIARNYDVYEVLKPIFQFRYVEGETETPPPAPKHNHASALNIEKRQAMLSRRDPLLKQQRSRTTPATTSTQPKLKRSATAAAATGSKENRDEPKKRGRPKGSTLSSTPSLKHSDTVPISQGYSNGRNSFAGGVMPAISRQNTEHDAVQMMASNMNLRQDDLRSVGTDEDIDDEKMEAGDGNGNINDAGTRATRMGVSEYDTQADLLTSKELFGVSRNTQEKNLHNLQRGHQLQQYPNELPLLRYHQPSINLSQENQVHNEYFANLLSYFLEDDKLKLDRIPEKFLTPPEPIAKIHINQAIDNDSNTIFHWACSLGNLTMIKFLIDKFKSEITFDIRNNYGETPLMFLVKFNNCYQLGAFEEILDILYNSLIYVDANGKTVLHHIVENKKERVAAYYLEVLLGKLVKGDVKELTTLINHGDSQGNTAVHIAAFNMNTKLINIFLNYHKFIDFKIRNLVSCTVEDYLASHNFVLRLDHGVEQDETEATVKSETATTINVNDREGADIGIGIGNGDDVEGIDEDVDVVVVADDHYNPLRTHSMNVHNSKLALKLIGNAANEITEKMTQLSYFVNQDLSDKDELMLNYYKILQRANEIKLSSQREILSLFKLEHLIDDLEEGSPQKIVKTESLFSQESTSVENVVDGYNLIQEKTRILQEEIYRLTNDLTFQILHKGEELFQILRKYKNLREFNYARDLEIIATNLANGNNFSSSSGSSSGSSSSKNTGNNDCRDEPNFINESLPDDQFELAKLLQLEIIKKKELMKKIMAETSHVPLPMQSTSTSISPLLTSGSPANGSLEERKDKSIIKKYAADQENLLIKYCKLISLSCGMEFDEIENSIDLIEESLLTRS